MTIVIVLTERKSLFPNMAMSCGDTMDARNDDTAAARRPEPRRSVRSAVSILVRALSWMLESISPTSSSVFVSDFVHALNLCASGTVASRKMTHSE